MQLFQLFCIMLIPAKNKYNHTFRIIQYMWKIVRRSKAKKGKKRKARLHSITICLRANACWGGWGGGELICDSWTCHSCRFGNIKSMATTTIRRSKRSHEND